MENLTGLDGSFAQLFGKVPTHEELIGMMLESDRWITSYDYLDKPYNLCKGKKVVIYPKDDIIHYKINRLKIEWYTITLGKIMINSDLDNSKLPPFMFNEIKQANDAGDLCIYISVITILLLELFKLVPKNTLKLVQGYYEYEVAEDCRIDFLSKLVENINTTIKCAHAWIQFPNGAVIDRTFCPENHEFIDKCPVTIEGLVPENVKFVGYAETLNTPYKYVKRFIERSNMTIPVWMANHIKGLSHIYKELE